MHKLFYGVGLVLMAWGAQAAPGDTFLLQIPGIDGGVTRSHYAGWIALNTFSAGITGVTDNGTGAGGASGKTTCSHLLAIKPLDTSSPELAHAAATGKRFATMTLVALAGGDQHEFLRFTLKNVVISSLLFGGDTVQSSRTETLSLAAPQFEITATPQLPDGTSGAPVTADITCSSVTG
jgi:type VI secretion system secreted protein Hcp